MDTDYVKRVNALTLEKALAVATYGESVAAYRYRTLVEKTTSAEHEKIFNEMANEEQGHHIRLQELTRKHFSGSDYVLKPEEKELVIVGPRLLEVSDGPAYLRAIEMICESERRTGRFYAALHKFSGLEELKPFLKEMSDECFEHADRLQAIPPPK